jgi:DNA-binding response OmpR family regulator
LGAQVKTPVSVLLVEDDQELAEFVRKSLEEEHCMVRVAYRGGSGLRDAELHQFDIIVLDVMLPEIDGFEITRRLRLQRFNTPILLLTGRDAPEDVVRGLDAGADDYLTKPFSIEILLARIRARTRPSTSRDRTHYRYADLFLDEEKREAIRAGRKLNLTRTEFAILECLMHSAGRVVTRDRLIEKVWGDREVTDNNLDVFIRFLRSKLEPPGAVRLLHTERGIGYSLREGSW